MLRISDYIIIFLLVLTTLAIIGIILYIIKFKKKSILISSIILLVIGILGIPASISTEYYLDDNSLDDSYFVENVINNEENLSHIDQKLEISFVVGEFYGDTIDYNPLEAIPFDYFINEGEKYYVNVTFGFWMNTYKIFSTYYSEVSFFKIEPNYTIDSNTRDGGFEISIYPTFSALYKAKNGSFALVKELFNYTIPDISFYISAPFEEEFINKVEVSDITSININEIKYSDSINGIPSIGLSSLELNTSFLKNGGTLTNSTIFAPKNTKQLYFKVSHKEGNFLSGEENSIKFSFDIENGKTYLDEDMPFAISVSMNKEDHDKYLFNSINLKDFTRSKVITRVYSTPQAYRVFNRP